MSEPPRTCDFVVIGGGILGLAVAREMLARHPEASLCVLEREDRLAAHQTSHSSGVIHAGIYYAPGSLKARLCVEGARLLYAYCEEAGIETRRNGKLIIATEEAELSRLDELERRGRANEVPGLRRIGPDQIAEIEPHARGIAALHSPATGVVDFARVAAGFAADIEAAGGGVVTGCEVRGLTPGAQRSRSATAAGRPRPASRSAAPEPGATAWRSRRARPPSRGSFPSAAPICGFAPSAASWSGPASIPCPIPSCPSSADT